MSRSTHQIYHSTRARAFTACNGRFEFLSAAIWLNANCRPCTSYTCMNMHATPLAYTYTTYITYCSQLNTHCVSLRHKCILHPPTSSIHYIDIVYTINSFYIDRQVDGWTKDQHSTEHSCGGPQAMPVPNPFLIHSLYYCSHLRLRTALHIYQTYHTFQLLM